MEFCTCDAGIVHDSQRRSEYHFKKEGQENRVCNINVTIVQTLINFLKPSEDATKALEGNLRPTIHRVYQ